MKLHSVGVFVLSGLFGVILFSHSFSTCTDEDKVCMARQEAVIPRGANADGRPSDAPAECVDRHESCESFRDYGECTKNPGWMIVNCPFSCRACHLRDSKVRCNRNNLDMINEPALQPGQLNAIFERIAANEDNRFGNITVLSTSPWMITFDDFLNDDEVEALIVTTNKWERSTDTGKSNAYGEAGRVLSNRRTSSNAWCRTECENHPSVKSVISKIEDATTVPYDNYESFQVLRYEIGQFYQTHHDTAASQYQLACGPRILTFFLYLSDVEEGGETNFPNLGIKVKPKKGRAVLWPGIMNENIHEIDFRTMHEAMPVKKGLKFAANTWIHLYNFKIPNLWGCTGAFD